MPGIESKTGKGGKNPFLTERRDELWKRLDKEGKPVSKEDLLKRAKAFRAKGS